MTGTVALRVAALDRMLRSHGGGLELESVSPDGVVRVRFTGMCVGCELRPVTSSSVIEPALAKLDVVTRVEIAGGRVSEYALASLQAASAPDRDAILQAVEQCEAEIGGHACGS
ncbi:NifU family protein [Ramlibacter sp. G-1-2-2]|uniref:NifU family protein n=1 Tax=Ramlibacter agri TaxID=2728837 RepID=A0A848H4Z3_9BURK|nr:NifU family protein [Ramlibacter agri]NML44310.1 NifU family protein [Ramlibacter agri]